MDMLEQHEVFEMEVLDTMNSSRLLGPLVFGGGSMLRLCHDLNRYSVDLDFWFVRETPQKSFFQKVLKILGQGYDITDSQLKRFTMLVEVRDAKYPRRLKLEIRREKKECDYEDKIAFSRFSTRQILLKAHSLDQTMINKIEALLDRGEIRDCFDIEFMLRRGIVFPMLPDRKVDDLRKRVTGFKDRDYKVKLGSIVDSKTRLYYVQNRFSYLLERLNSSSIQAKSTASGRGTLRG
jgi:predicted nucleotidyltransferase component of viral defense system